MGAVPTSAPGDSGDSAEFRDGRALAARCTAADAHCHVDFAADPAAFARAAQAAGCFLAASTVEPAGFVRLRGLLPAAGFPLVRIGVGLHPRWVDADSRRADAQAAQLIAALPQADFVGEVGLDLSARYAATEAQQRRVLAQIAVACAARPGTVLSLHAVRSAGAVLDILEGAGALEACRCVFHWFSGTSDELCRAREAGCWFSVGERILATRRGQAYARQMPADRLLLETDLPAQPGDTAGFGQLAASLKRAFDEVARLCGTAQARAAVEQAVCLFA